jgi:hypothetical protein
MPVFTRLHLQCNHANYSGLEERVLDNREAPTPTPAPTLTPTPTASTHTIGVTSVDAMIQQNYNESNTTGYEEPAAQVQEISALPATNPLPPKPYGSPLEFLIYFSVPKSPYDVFLIKQNPYISYLDHPSVASRTAQASSLLFVCSTALCICLGIDESGSIDHGFAIPVTFLFYMFLRLMVVARRVCNQVYFVLEDIDAGKRRSGTNLSSAVPIVRHRSSAAGSSISVATIRSLPVDLGQGASSLLRHDTEADMGLVPPARRQTYPQRQV